MTNMSLNKTAIAVQKEYETRKSADPLNVLAKRVNEKYTAHAKRGLIEAMDIGDDINEAFARIGPHEAEQRNWLYDACPDIALRTAQRYVQYAQNRAIIEKEMATKALTFNAATKLIEKPTATPATVAGSAPAASTPENKNGSAAKSVANTTNKPADKPTVSKPNWVETKTPPKAEEIELPPLGGLLSDLPPARGGIPPKADPIATKPSAPHVCRCKEKDAEITKLRAALKAIKQYMEATEINWKAFLKNGCRIRDAAILEM